MSKTFKYIFKKNNPNAEFYTEPSWFLDHVKSKYIDTGKCLEFRKKVIIDEVLQEVYSSWIDEESIIEFQLDPICISIKEEIIVYNQHHDIETISIGVVL